MQMHPDKFSKFNDEVRRTHNLNKRLNLGLIFEGKFLSFTPQNLFKHLKYVNLTLVGT